MTSGRQRVGIKDVAHLAGVSVGTVSLVLNHPHKVSERRKAAVLTAIEDLGYVPNHAARQLKAGSSRLVGYLFPDPLNPYFTNLGRGIQLEAERQGLFVLGATSYGVLAQRRRYLSIFEQQRARGIIVAPRTTDLTTEMATSRRGTPVVLVSAREPSGKLCSVGADDISGGGLAIEHLITNGCRRIAVIAAAGQLVAEDRWHGIQQAALRHRGIELQLIKVAEAAVEAGSLVAEEMLAQPPDRRPDGILCTSDLLALGVVHTVVMDGRLAIPNDIAVVGYDDLTFACGAIIPLTSIRQHETRMGEVAVRLLEDELHQPGHVHSNVLLDPLLVVRQTTRQ